MKGKHGVSMQGVEYAPKKKGNALCRNCEHLMFRATGKNKGTRAEVCSYYCGIKRQPRWYTSQCYCKLYEPKSDVAETTDKKIINILQSRAEKTQTERINKRLNKRRKAVRTQ